LHGTAVEEDSEKKGEIQKAVANIYIYIYIGGWREWDCVG
jgi:hypothetical protein